MLRDDFIAHREKRGHIPFDEEGDEQFCKEHFGASLGVFCNRVMRELIEIEEEIDKLKSR